MMDRTDGKPNADASAYKPLKELTMKQQWQLQGLYKKEARQETLTDEEQELLDVYRSEWSAEKQRSKLLWPIIILLGFSALMRIFYFH